MQIQVTIPGLLADCAGGQRRFPVEAATLAEALERMLADHPPLRPHLYDEAMRLRRHVLLFYNERNIATIPDRNLPLQPGDRVFVLQAVSGG